MKGISRTMIVGYLTLIVGLLALPQFLALIPESYLPVLTCVSGVATLLMRWLNGALGINTLTIVGLATLIAGLLGIPELLAVIPASYMPVITAIAGFLTLITRYLAGQVTSDPAAPVGLMFRNGSK
jgi:hypothetical protein